MTKSKDMEWILNVDEMRAKVESMSLEERVKRLERYLESHHLNMQLLHSALEWITTEFEELDKTN